MAEAGQVYLLMTARRIIGHFGGMFIFSFVSFPLSAQAQAAFQNLNFEAATPGPPISGPIFGADYQPFSFAFPGWNASIGGDAVTEVLENDYTLGTAAIDLFVPGWTSVDPGVIDGNYTAFLQSGGGGNVSLWQNGTIPANAASLQFAAWNWPSVNTEFIVSFAGNSLSPLPLYSAQTASGQDYTVYGANIANYAGQTGELAFTSVVTSAPSWTELDDVTFSTQAVPEPNTVQLGIMAAAIMLGLQTWARQSRFLLS